MSRGKNNPRAATQRKSGAIVKALSLAWPVIFIITGMSLLCFSSYDYLRKAESLSYFSYSGWFFRHCIDHPGGLIDWTASFLTQFFYHPWLGGSIFIAMLTGLWWLIVKAFRIPKGMYGIGGIIPCMMLLFALIPGYLIYMCKTPGFIYTGVIGFAISSGYVWIYRKATTLPVKLSVAIVYALTYPLLGVYTLLGLVLTAIGEATGKHKNRWIAAATAVVLAISIPQLYYYLIESHAMKSQLYISGLPRLGLSFHSELTPYWVSVATLAILAAINGHWGQTEHRPGLSATISSLIIAFSICSIFIWRNNDAALKTMISMDIAMQECDYSLAAEKARALDEPPTRAINLLTHAALTHIGEAGDRLFTYQMSDTEYKSPYAGLALRLSMAHTLDYYFGRVNDSYRWNMENMVEYGYKNEYLRYMAKCALLNGEYKLAMRYLRMLSETLYHKEWASKYIRYAENPSLIEKDPELMKIKQLNAYGNQIAGDNGMIEEYLSTMTAGMAGGTPPLVEISMQFNMIRKDIAGFWPRFMLYARTHDRLPRHYQEAAILFSALENQVDWHQFRIDPEVSGEFSRFMEMARQNGNYSDEHNRSVFAPEFGHTYWYYYFFVNNLKTT